MLGTIVDVEHHRHLWIEATSAERQEVGLGIEDQPVSAVRYRAIYEKERLHPTICVGPCVAQLGPAFVRVLHFQTDGDAAGRCSSGRVEYVG